jgi:uncharacterized protein YigE (DUF2233 family)
LCENKIHDDFYDDFFKNKKNNGKGVGRDDISRLSITNNEIVFFRFVLNKKIDNQ